MMDKQIKIDIWQVVQLSAKNGDDKKHSVAVDNAESSDKTSKLGEEQEMTDVPMRYIGRKI